MNFCILGDLCSLSNHTEGFPTKTAHAEKEASRNWSEILAKLFPHSRKPKFYGFYCSL